MLVRAMVRAAADTNVQNNVFLEVRQTVSYFGRDRIEGREQLRTPKKR